MRSSFLRWSESEDSLRLMFATAEPLGLKMDPWKLAGRKPLPKQSRPPGGMSPPLTATKPGRFWFSLPRP